MRWLLASIAAWFSLMGPAHSATIVHETGVTSPVEVEWAFPGAGRYRIDFAASAAVAFSTYSHYTDHWDIFYAPPPKPHDEYIDGNTASWLFDSLGGVRSGHWEVEIPETIRIFFLSSESSYGPGWGVPVGTLLYYEERAEDPFIALFIDEPLPNRPFTYWLSVSAVPEPSSWALMIVGFALIGAMVRRRRVRSAPQPPNTFRPVSWRTLRRSSSVRRAVEATARATISL